MGDSLLGQRETSFDWHRTRSGVDKARPSEARVILFQHVAKVPEERIALAITSESMVADKSCKLFVVAAFEHG